MPELDEEMRLKNLSALLIENLRKQIVKPFGDLNLMCFYVIFQEAKFSDLLKAL